MAKKKQQFGVNGEPGENLTVEFQESQMDAMLDLINLCQEKEIEYEVVVR